MKIQQKCQINNNLFAYITGNTIKEKGEIIMDKYEYARCSINENKQDINRQKRGVKTLGGVVEMNIYWEYESGTKVDCIELNKLLESS
ncbi:recombinase family protein [Cellulosilyticum lentocellum]|uniref:recombinase family protein n=1 Tax=Cellulosilyticum lentocellum TaxID=29360 RepID=UPI00138ADD6C|nr:recombinase family protein [Cellulosilyticum lentocellum]